MMRRTLSIWKALLALFIACALASMGAWAFLLTTICSNPRTPMPQTQHVIPYSCHGMTVFISSLQDEMLHWLIPIEVVFIFLSVGAAAMVLLAAAKVRIDVQVHVTDTSSGNPPGGR